MPKVEITSVLIPSKSYEIYRLEQQQTYYHQASDTTSGVLSKSYTDEYYEDSLSTSVSSIRTETDQDTYALNSASLFTNDDIYGETTTTTSSLNESASLANDLRCSLNRHRSVSDDRRSSCSSLTNVTPLLPIESNFERLRSKFQGEYMFGKDEIPSRDKTKSPKRQSFKSSSRNSRRKSNDYVQMNYINSNNNNNADELSPRTEFTDTTAPKTDEIKRNNILDCYTNGKTQETLSNGTKKITYRNGTIKYIYPEQPQSQVTSPTCLLSPQSPVSIASVLSGNNTVSQFDSILKDPNDFLRSTIQFENGDLVDLYESGTEIYYLRQQDLVIEKHTDSKEVYRYLDTNTIEIKYPDGFVECFKNDDVQEVQLIYSH